MSLTPPHSPPPGTPTPTRKTIPRPVPSPLRPSSPSSRRVSASNTPGSPSPGPSTPPPGEQRQKTRARDLLRKHYGLGVGPPPAMSASTNAKSRDPMDLDSAAFDAKSYYDQLITTSSLPTLLKRENELLSDIRQLDSERQSLVYNHHHELIAASDTIASMKMRAESLDADLELLKAAFSEISRLGAEVAYESEADGRSEDPRTPRP